jgi:hypothetical protein
MKSRIGALAALGLALACPGANAAPATVNLRVEGADDTIFEGQVKTDGHAIEQDKNGSQPCDGTNGGANPTPGPTVTSALDDAVAWDGTFDTSFSDFLVNRIGPDRSTSTQFWGTALNGTATELGGCQVQVKTGDDVLWAYDMFSAKQFLALSGPRTARLDKPFKVTVTDTKNGNKPVKGANVGNVAKTNSKGQATIVGTDKGQLLVKAERKGAIRSNALVVRVR